MSQIKILSEQTINQIAAGEVIENPASVVKELIENALDAGAARIVIEIKGGGFQLIRISDDGCGMDKDDAVLSLERHATSKIRAAEDLQRIATMGFRGEALASIAAISQLTLVTAQKEGIKVEVAGGRMVGAGPASRTRGTTVEVRSLFYNVPARKKFQKSAQASNVDIHRVVTQMSFAYPEVAFELINNEEVIFSATAYHKDFLEALSLRMKEVLSLGGIPIDKNGVRGYLGMPGASRQNRTGQYLFVNKRAVVSPLVSFAVRDAYGTRIDTGRHPIFVLHLELPAHMVDVNVHPQKKEVRFQDEQGLKRKILEAIALGFGGEKEAVFTSEPVSFSAYEGSLIFREEASVQDEALPYEIDPLPIGMFEHFLLLDAEEPGILVVDLLAAQERIALASLQSQDAVRSQGLLLPIKIDLPASEVQAVVAHLSDLEKMGFSLRLIGKDSFCIDAIPAFLEPEAAGDAILAVVYGENGELSRGRMSRNFCNQTLAKFARRQKKVFMLQEALALWKQAKALGALPDQPITVYLSRDAITKWFTP